VEALRGRRAHVHKLATLQSSRAWWRPGKLLGRAALSRCHAQITRSLRLPPPESPPEQAKNMSGFFP
jgi:hypothetical protein